ncbi:hypothetical protein [Hufsiella ginkgonis]|uniref:Uncharacterized protein n=1 Tax=Hufsiella ginkgonis TaxID=2695274 RepID=A0A7K1Y0S1_9SPHI|nr:hypothetical protein [Hufsiella ginkgonis]MXV16629.1 hypothetical protein [Hufsiella ginkgonis]
MEKKNNTISVGDYVKHRDPKVNGGLEMAVNAIENGMANCDHLVGYDPAVRQDWFPAEDLIIVSPAGPGLA